MYQSLAGSPYRFCLKNFNYRYQKWIPGNALVMLCFEIALFSELVVGNLILQKGLPFCMDLLITQNISNSHKNS